MRSRRFISASIILLFSAAAFGSASDEFNTLLDEEWEARLENSPVFASSLGDRRYNRLWPDRSISAIEDYQNQSREFLRRTYAIDKEALSETDQLNFELFRRTLQDRVDGYQFKNHLIPFSHRHRYGVQNLENTTSRLSFESVQDYDDWLARMDKVDEYIDQTIALAEEGRKQGYMPPKVLMQRMPDQIAVQLVDDAEDSPFFALFEELPDSISEDEQGRLRAAARASIEASILPAYRKFDRYFNKTYLPASRDSIGLSALPKTLTVEAKTPAAIWTTDL